jgi:Domain of Unknown Function (DUF1206)
VDLRLAEMRAVTRRIVEWLGRGGGVARAVVFITVGAFLVVAALTTQPRQAKGLDSALRGPLARGAGRPLAAGSRRDWAHHVRRVLLPRVPLGAGRATCVHIMRQI